MDNLEVWNKVKKTDLKWTIESTQRNGLISINGMYCTMRATELFGPCGIGWGYDIIEERIDDGVQQKHKEGDYITKTHTIKIKLWYMIGDQKGTITHFGHTPYIMKSKYGAYEDTEAPKKSLTDAIKKCLSMIGVGADIHLGQFDDHSYRSELVIEAKQQREIDQKEKEDDLRSKISSQMGDAALVYAKSKNIATLTKVHKDAMIQIRQLYEKAKADPEKSINNLVKMFEEMKGKLKATEAKDDN